MAHDGNTRQKVVHILQLSPVAATAHVGNDDNNIMLICAICLDDEVPKAFSVLPCQH